MTKKKTQPDGLAIPSPIAQPDNSTPENPRPDGSYGTPVDETTTTETETETETVATVQDHFEGINVFRDMFMAWPSVGGSLKYDRTNQDGDIVTDIATVTYIDEDGRPHFDKFFNPEIVYSVEIVTTTTDAIAESVDPSKKSTLVDDNPTSDQSKKSVSPDVQAASECCRQDPNAPADYKPEIKTPWSEIRKRM